MKHLTVTVVILMLGFGACKKSETTQEPQKQNISSENQSETFSKTMYVNTEAWIRRRSEPTLDSIRIGAYSHGEKIEVIERTGTPVTIDGITDYWYKTKANITFEGKLYEYSWVFGGYLSESKPEIKQVQQTILSGSSFVSKLADPGNMHSANSIVFRGNDFTEYVWDGPGISGTYTVSGNSVTLNYNASDDYGPAWTRTITIVDSNTLKFGDDNFWKKEEITSAGYWYGVQKKEIVSGKKKLKSDFNKN